MVRKVDPHIGLIVLAVALATLLVFVVVGLVADTPIVWGLLGIMPSLLVAMIVFGCGPSTREYRVNRRAAGRRGQLVLNTLRGGLDMAPAVAVTRQDVVHRAVGRPASCWSAGSPTRNYRAAPPRSASRSVRAGGAVYDVIVGDADSPVRLRRLHTWPSCRRISAAEVREVRPTASCRSSAPRPQGPMPRSIRSRKCPVHPVANLLSAPVELMTAPRSGASRNAGFAAHHCDRPPMLTT